MGEMLVVWLVSAVTLFVISRLYPGLEIQSFGTAMIGALVLGLLNALLLPILRLLAFLPLILTFGLFSWVLNAAIIMIAASLVPGFRVNGCLSALVVAILVAILNSILLAWVL
jgi:putative membrane protein